MRICRCFCHANCLLHLGRYPPGLTVAQMQNVDHREQAPSIAADLEKELAHAEEDLWFLQGIRYRWDRSKIPDCFDSTHRGSAHRRGRYPPG